MTAALSARDPECLAHNRRTVRRVFEDFVNTGDFTVVDEIYRTDFVDHEGLPGAPSGRDGVKFTIGELRSAFPDLHVTIEEMSADGDFVVIHNTWRGTHRGTIVGIEPTGHFIESKGIVVWRLHDGLIAERWALNVSANIIAQLGMARMSRKDRPQPRPTPTDRSVVLDVVDERAWAQFVQVRRALLTEQRRDFERSRKALAISSESIVRHGTSVTFTVRIASAGAFGPVRDGRSREIDSTLRAAAEAALGADPWTLMSQAPADEDLGWSAPLSARELGWGKPLSS